MKKANTSTRLLAVMLATLMMMGLLPITAAAAGEVGVITETHLNFNKYETFYYLDSEVFYFDGDLVEFTSESWFTAGGSSYELKNKKVEMTVTIEEGTVDVRFTPTLDVPIAAISGQWNSGSGGERKIAYDTDIPGLESVKSVNNNLSALTISGLVPGAYHLTNGSVFEKANAYSPGTDLGSGVVTEAYFGRLPDVTFTVGPPPEPVTAEVFVSYQYDGYIIPKQLVAVSSDMSDIYGYDDAVSDGVSALDALIAVHRLYYKLMSGGEFAESEFAEWLSDALVVSGGGISNCFGDMGFNIMAAVNGEMPFDTSLKFPATDFGPESYLSLSIPEIEIVSGDYTEFFSPVDMMWLDCYTWFSSNGEKVESLTVHAGEEISLSLVGYPYMSYGAAVDGEYRDGSWTVDYGYCEDLPIVLLEVDEVTGYVVVADTLTEADEDGDFMFTLSEPGTYILSALSDADWWQYIFAPWLEINVEEPDTPPHPTPDYYTPSAENRVYDRFENEVWLQQGFVELPLEGAYTIYPRRLPEAISSTVNNDVYWPNFNFEIVEGDSVTVASETVSGLAGNGANPGATINVGRVSAVKPGVSIVKVTYDAFEHPNGGAFGASAENNAAYIAFCVTGEDIVGEELSISSNTGLRHPYDTLYYSDGDLTGDYCMFEMTPAVSGAVTVEVICNGSVVTANGGTGDAGGGTYALPLQNMQNIIGIKATDAGGKVRYHYEMIDARYMEISVENKGNPGAPFAAGDSAMISFRGITQPLHKLASIYNPNSTRVQYQTAFGTQYGASTQWSLATSNSILVNFTRGGEFRFTNGVIAESWWGDALGTEKIKTTPGAANLNAVTISNTFSRLPDFIIEVAETEIADNYDPDTGWFTIFDPDGTLLNKIDALLADAPFNQTPGTPNNYTSPRGYNYSVVKKLRIVGKMANADFGSVLFGLRAVYQSIETGYTRLAALEELDLSSALVSQIPNFGFQDHTLLKTVRLPEGVWANNLLVFNGCPELTTLVCGDGPMQDGIFDLSGMDLRNSSGDRAIINAYLDRNGLGKVTNIVFPDYSGGISFQAPSAAGGLSGSRYFTSLREIVFPGPVKSIGSAYGAGALSGLANLERVLFHDETPPAFGSGNNAFTVNGEAVAVAYVPDSAFETYAGDPDFNDTGTGDRFTDIRPLSDIFTPADKHALEQAIADAEALVEDEFTAASWSGLAPALRIAKAVQKNKLAAALQVNEACAALIQAMGNLELRPVIQPADKRFLEDMLAEAWTLIQNTGYTAESRTALQGVCDDANAVWVEPDATQEQVDAALLAVESAIAALRPVKTGLAAAIAEAEALVRSEYTASSWTLLQTALGTAKSVYDRENSTLEQVSDALSLLQAAVAGLVKNSGDPGEPSNITVSFRLIGSTLSDGDVDLSRGDYNGAEYVTWIATKNITLPAAASSGGATMYDLFVKALSDAGLTAVGQETNYVSDIYAPEAFGGYKLSEFANGPRSGWMYTINGVHPGYGLKTQGVKNGDVVIWHYVNDFAYEAADWNDPAFPSLGNAATWNKWMDLSKTPDVDPPKEGGPGTPPGNSNTGTPTGSSDEGANIEDEETPLGEFDGWENPFTDVEAADWFYEAVAFAQTSGLMIGTADDAFSPNSNLSRAMIVTMLWRMEGMPAVEQSVSTGGQGASAGGQSSSAGGQGSSAAPFTDVAKGEWYYDAVLWASENGIVEGYGDGSTSGQGRRFGPEDDITREQLATILYRYAEYKGFDTAPSMIENLASFTDAGLVSEYADSAMRWANRHGLIIGRTATTLAPQGTATRAEAATILMRFIKGFAEE